MSLTTDERVEILVYAKGLILGLTRAQRRVFDNLCVGIETGSRKTLDHLVDLGLVERHTETLAGFPPMSVTRHDVPFGSAAHIAWCAICSKES